MCPPEEEDHGEPNAAHKLMLFSRARCPGPEHCADPLAFRSLLMPSDDPDDVRVDRLKPLFWPCWKACRCEMEMHAAKADEKEQAAGKIAVLADTTTMRDMQGNSDWHPEWNQWEQQLRDSGTTHEPRFRPH